uniref:Uncharacterized protein n=1 Tax=Micrurus lemniscatus lemniscatus TaxID=129467 RepID=A0A2D4J8H8_MICLE
MPLTAPSRVIPRTNKIVSTRYGNVAVKYTTFPEDFTLLMRQRKTTIQETPKQPSKGSRTSPRFPMSLDSFNTYRLQYSSLGLVRFRVWLKICVMLTDEPIELLVTSNTLVQFPVFQKLLQYVQGSTRVIDEKK